MTGHFDFGHQRDMTLAGVGHQVADLGLGVEERPVRLAVTDSTVALLGRLAANRPDLSQPWVLADLQPPALLGARAYASGGNICSETDDAASRCQYPIGPRRSQVDEAIDLQFRHILVHVEYRLVPKTFGLTLAPRAFLSLLSRD